MSTNLLKLTPAEYDQMIAKGAFDGINRRIEMIHGELRAMNPAGPLHCDVINYLTRWSVMNTAHRGWGIQVQSGIDLDDSRPEPDIAWLKPGRYTTKHPGSEDILLLIEVADSSLSGDLGEKARLYAEHGIDEYWVIDAQARCVHVHRDSDGQQYLNRHRVESSGKLCPQCEPGAVLELAELFQAE